MLFFQNNKVHLNQLDLPISSTGSYGVRFVDGENGVHVAAINDDGTKDSESFVTYEAEDDDEVDDIDQERRKKRRLKRRHRKHRRESQGELQSENPSELDTEQEKQSKDSPKKEKLFNLIRIKPAKAMQVC